MKIDSISSMLPQTSQISLKGVQSPDVQAPSATGETSGASFGDTMKDAIRNVSDLQNNADQVASKLATGEPVEIHQAMLAMQKASMALQFTVQVRNKVVEAYQEIMRTQV